MLKSIALIMWDGGEKNIEKDCQESSPSHEGMSTLEDEFFQLSFRCQSIWGLLVGQAGPLVMLIKKQEQAHWLPLVGLNFQSLPAFSCFCDLSSADGIVP